jgi:HK97 family phage prohead protease
VFGATADLGNFKETIRRGAFARGIAEREDCHCLFNHDANAILGRVGSGTLALAEDSRGLRFSCELPNTSIGSDVLESVKRGDISGCSFGFMCRKDSWSSDGGTRELQDVALLDVGPVTYPAYEATTVQARSAALGVDRVGIYRVIAAEVSDELELEVLRARLRLAQML